jgi:hypothetical protein
LALCALGASAYGQSYPSFNAANFSGVNVSSSGLNYTVSLQPGAFITVNNVDYGVSGIFGFWTLSSDMPLSADGAPQSNWTWNESSSSGNIAGWHNPSKSDMITPGGNLTFSYSQLAQQNVEDIGFHLLLTSNFNGTNTAYFKGQAGPVPEPASLAYLGLGAIVLVRRRRR